MADIEHYEQRAVVLRPGDAGSEWIASEVRAEIATLGMQPIDLWRIYGMLTQLARILESYAARESQPHQTCMGCGMTSYHSSVCAGPKWE